MVETRLLPAQINLPEGAGIQDVFRHLAENVERTERVTIEVEKAFNQGCKVLVLTERTDHLSVIEAALVGRVQNLFTLHGRMSKKQRLALTDELAALPPDVPRVLCCHLHREDGMQPGDTVRLIANPTRVGV